MRRRLFLLLILLFVVAAQITLGQEKAPNLTGLQLEKVVVYSSCASDANTICSGDEAKLHITTEIDDDDDLGFLTYAYTVGAGKISGKGAKVICDLSGVRPGNYKITAAVNDGCGFCGKTMTKDVEIRAAPDVEKITLSDSEISGLCPGTISAIDYCSKEQMIVDVTTTAKTNNDALTYYYAVTGGKIVGSGASVKWDLTEAKTGTYSITAGIGKDNVIHGKTATKTLVKKWCECDPGCDCNTLSAEGPKSAKRGDTIVVTAKVVGGPEVTYKWTVYAGTILSDPTGRSIMVTIPKDFKPEAFNATVELSGTNPGCRCQTVETVVIPIHK